MLSEDKRLFRLIWRCNAVLIFLAGVLGVLIVAFSAYRIVQDLFFEPRQRTHIVNVDETNEIQPEWRLGRAQRLAGRSILYAPLYSDQAYRQVYYSKSTQSVRNYLFLSGRDGSMHWLLPGIDQLIAETHELAPQPYGEQQQIEAIFYVLVTQDTNQDERLTIDDQKILAISDSTGRRYTVIKENVQQFIGVEMLDDHEVSVVYESGEKGYWASVSLPDFTLLAERVVPELQTGS